MAAPSRLHSKVTGASLAENAKVALLEAVMIAGLLVIVVTGGRSLALWQVVQFPYSPGCDAGIGICMEVTAMKIGLLNVAELLSVTLTVKS
jgi:hypothetical protein